MTTLSIIRAALLASLCLVLTGCLLARQSAPTVVLAPEVTVVPAAEWPVVGWSLLVDRPRADAMSDSARVLIRPAPAQLQVYKGAAWLEPVPDLLQSILLRAFEDSGRITAVSRVGNARSRFRLYTEIRRFEAVASDGGRLTVQLEIHAKLILTRDASVLSAVNFNAQARSADNQLPALTRAFEQALQELTNAVVGWTLQQGEQAEAGLQPAGLYRDSVAPKGAPTMRPIGV